MTKKLFSALILGLSLLFLAACGQKNESTDVKAENTVTITSKQGKVEVPLNPQRIVSLDLGAADTLRALGKVDQLVGLPKKGLPSYLQNLPETIENVGSLKEPDLEAIAKLKPDVIIASRRTESSLDQLAQIAPTIYFDTPNTDYWPTTKANILALASLFGQETVDQAQEKVATLDKEIDQLAGLNDKSDKQALTLMLNEGQISAFGPESRYAFLYETLHFNPTKADIKDSRHGQEISFEGIHEINPDMIFVINRTLAIGGDDTTTKDLLDNALVQETKAAQDKAIVQLSSDVWYLSQGGLESTELMIKDVKDWAGR